MNRSALFALLTLFFGVFLVCAGLLQIYSGLPPQKSGAIDQLNGALLWASSILTLLIAAQSTRPAWRLLFWLAMSAGFGALAIDEVFEFHESTKFSLGDDDYIKIIAWGCAAIGVYLIWHLSRPARAVVTALMTGFAFTTLWLLSDMGDGDFFTIPIPPANLLWLEEYFELLAAQFYLTGFLLHYQDLIAAAPAGTQAPLAPLRQGQTPAV